MADVWLFDSVTQFLKGANWAVPVWDFIDDNCIVFDSEEENKLEYSTSSTFSGNLLTAC